MNFSMVPDDTGSLVPAKELIVKTSAPWTVTSVFSVRAKPGNSERVTFWVVWNAWSFATVALDMDISVISSFPLPGTDVAGTDSVKSLHLAYFALAWL